MECVPMSGDILTAPRPGSYDLCQLTSLVSTD
jgi:hypothetical protein